MITECAGNPRLFDLSGTETLFVQGVVALTKTILIPVAISVFTWKISQTGGPHARTSLLGLSETLSNSERRLVEMKNREA